jgi:hypothetical protein
MECRPLHHRDDTAPKIRDQRLGQIDMSLGARVNYHVLNVPRPSSDVCLMAA